MRSRLWEMTFAVPMVLSVLLTPGVASAAFTSANNHDGPVQKVIVATRTPSGSNAFIRAYDRDGNILWTNSTQPSGDKGFTALAVEPGTVNLYSSSVEGTDHISQFNHETGVFVTNLLNGPNNTVNAEDIAWGPDDTLYIANQDTTQRARNLDPSPLGFGTFQSEAGHTPITGVTVYEDGTVYASLGSTSQRIQRFQGTSDVSTGDFIDDFVTGLGTPFSGYLTFYQDRLYFKLPSGIYVADNPGGGAAGGGFSLFISAGQLGDPLVGPGQFVFNEQSNMLYVTSRNTNQILRYNATTGAFIDVFATLPAGSTPTGLALVTPEPSVLVVLGAGLLACALKRTSKWNGRASL